MPHHIAILGAGLIGGSWASLFLSRGHTVTLADPAPGSDRATRAFITAAWPHLAALDDIPAAPPWQNLQFAGSIAAACSAADFVQECGPDRIAAKRAMLAEAETTLAPEALIASSTSSLLASDIQTGARHPGRILVAHPMNPPHLVPLVELVAGKLTSPDTLPRARAFYESLDRVVIELQKERVGHLANRLTAALYREAVHVVAEGIATVADVDRAIAYGPGMRWAFMGPHLIYHLGGGAGGYRAYLEHLGPTQQTRWADLGTPTLDAATIEALVAGLEQELSSLDADSLAETRDSALVALTRLKRSLPL